MRPPSSCREVSQMEPALHSDMNSTTWVPASPRRTSDSSPGVKVSGRESNLLRSQFTSEPREQLFRAIGPNERTTKARRRQRLLSLARA